MPHKHLILVIIFVIHALVFGWTYKKKGQVYRLVLVAGFLCLITFYAAKSITTDVGQMVLFRWSGIGIATLGGIMMIINKILTYERKKGMKESKVPMYIFVSIIELNNFKLSTTQVLIKHLIIETALFAHQADQPFAVLLHFLGRAQAIQRRGYIPGNAHVPLQYFLGLEYVRHAVQFGNDHLGGQVLEIREIHGVILVQVHDRDQARIGKGLGNQGG